MSICQCGTQSGYLHERDCPWPLFVDDPERVQRWMMARDEWRALWAAADDPEYADVDEAGQLALGVPGEQRAIPGLAKPRPAEHPTFDL